MFYKKQEEKKIITTKTVDIPDDAIPEQDKTETVNGLDIVCLYVYTVHVHEYVADHDHSSLMVVPGRVQRSQEIIVQRVEHVATHLVHQMLGDHIFEAGVQLLAVLVQHHRVRVTVQFFEAQAAVVLLLDLLYRVLQHLPDQVHVLLVHGGLLFLFHIIKKVCFSTLLYEHSKRNLLEKLEFSFLLRVCSALVSTLPLSIWLGS